MRLRERIARLERAGRARAGCPRCGGRGMAGVEIRRPGESPSVSPGCPGCGRVRVLKVIVVERPPS